jgi:hypothetical protein
MTLGCIGKVKLNKYLDEGPKSNYYLYLPNKFVTLFNQYKIMNKFN